MTARSTRPGAPMRGADRRRTRVEDRSSASRRPSPTVDVGLDGGDPAEQQRQRKIVAQRDRQLLGAAQPAEAPVAGAGRDRVDRTELGQHRRRALRAPARQAGIAVGRVAHQRQVVGDRARAARRTWRSPRPRSTISRLRRSYCTTRVPRTHWPRSLSGVTISTCSTRGSASATAAAAPRASSASCSTIAHTVNPAAVERLPPSPGSARAARAACPSLVL